MKDIAIVISTYYRPDGRTKYYLERNLNSLKTQTDTNFKVFLIGDKYENDDEFHSYKDIFEPMYMENLSYAKEREKYKGVFLWASGGVNAVNVGIKKALSEGYEWIINMDHDDYFLPTHIEELKNMISDNVIFVCSKTVYTNSKVLPDTNTKKYIPKGGNLIKSSACVNFSKINITFRDVYEEEKRCCSSDSDFWNRLNTIITKNNYESYCTGNITCVHDEEGYTLTQYK